MMKIPFDNFFKNSSYFLKDSNNFLEKQKY